MIYHIGICHVLPIHNIHAYNNVPAIKNHEKRSTLSFREQLSTGLAKKQKRVETRNSRE